MMMKNWLAGLALTACLLAAGLSSHIFAREAVAQNSTTKVPVFEVDRARP